MNTQLKLFLNKLKLEKEFIPCFYNAILEKVKYYEKSNKYVIHIKFSTLPSTNLTNALKSIKEKCNFNNEIVIKYDDNVEITLNYINDIFKDVILDKYKDSTLFQSIKDIEIDLDEEKIKFLFNSSTQRDLFFNYKVKIQNIYNKVGVNRIVDFLLLEDKKKLKEVNEELQEEKERKVNEALKEKEKKPKEKKNLYRKIIPELMKISELTSDDKNISVIGKIFDIAENKNRRKKIILSVYITDYEDSIMVKCFEGPKFTKEELLSLKEGQWVEVNGSVDYDLYAKEEVISATSIKEVESRDIEIKDDAPVKRVELHVHTKMSAMDGVCDAKEYIEQALKWGHKAIAITDHGVVQAFPDAKNAAKGKPIKIIYGLEAYVVDEKENHIMNPSDVCLENSTYVVFDLETTGLSSRTEQIIEIGAVKAVHGIIIDRFQTFVNPERKLPSNIINLTNINDNMLKDAPKIDEALQRFLEFIGDAVLVAHNAVFDIAFLKEAMNRLGYPNLNNPIIDTLPLSRVIYSEHKSHNLGSVARRLNIEYDEDTAHRADYDARVLFNVFDIMIRQVMEKYKITKHLDLINLQKEDNYLRKRPFHATIYAKNQKGIKDLYKLVSTSSIDYYSEIPRIPRKLLAENRENLIIGSACFNGEVFDIASTRSHKELVETIKFYDFIEVQPLDNYSYLIDTGSIENKDKLIKYIKFIIEASKEAKKLVVATSDAHYVNPRQKIFRDVYIRTKAIGGVAHPLYDFKKRVRENPNQHFRTTNEMLEAFSYLDESLAYEIVVTNSNLIVDMVEDVEPLRSGTYTPKIKGAEEELKRLCYYNAHRIYGEKLPEIVEKRIDKELTSIINNGFAVIYYIAHKLVKKSTDDGYLVGSRGSVGSSLVAYLADITEVNALPPHYICDNCKYSDFSNDEGVYSGIDLPSKTCPVCGMPLRGDGQDIPFETFLGFKGDKVPDIDLNFSGDYQATVHEYTKVLFGEDYVFRAGTISTVAEKTSFGYVKGYYEDLGIVDKVRNAQINYVAKNCENVKKTTGQHPGGIIVIPNDMDVYDFTPIQYPADSLDASWKTTHFDFYAIHDNVLKLDILGHVDPTALRMLQDLTGIDPKEIPCNDEKVLSLFTSCEVLGVSEDDILNENGATGIPEFGTKFVKRMLTEAKPKTFAELVHISGLSHGTDVWDGNAQVLIQNKTCTLMEVIGCRDDIMVYLIKKGLDSSLAFKIMEAVRKGRGLTKEQESEMRKKNVPEWYIESCKKIKYMFPKAHAVAYVTMALRLAWLKVYKPLEYYAVFFSTRCEAFEIDTMIQGREAILTRLLGIRARLSNYATASQVSKKENQLVDTLESALEMTVRGYKFTNIDLYKSDAKNFIIDKENNAIIPPFITVDGLGETAAKSIVEAREDKEFLSIEDLLKRTQLNSTCAKTLEKMGVLDSLQPENQLKLELF